jgi:hypothetical protein
VLSPSFVREQRKSHQQDIEEQSMTFYSDQTPSCSMAELLQEAAARTGFTANEMQEVLESELSIDELLAYIDAVVSQRMN